MITEIKTSEMPKLNDPILIEGLPGIAYIGRNVAGYLIDELEAKKFAELYSSYFPPIVLLDQKQTGIMKPINNEFYYYKTKDPKKRDFVILIGDAQSTDSQGHYEIVKVILDAAEKFGVKEIITLGGFATGKLEKKHNSVFGATMDEKNIKAFSKCGVKFENTNIGQIIGASALLLSEGHKRGIGGVCLMGETSGMLVSDPISTENVLKVLSQYLGVKIDMATLDKKIKETESVIKKIEALQGQIMSATKQQATPNSKSDDMGYIG
ncbi:MAG: proteasome assembly chaperone family protein [Candidatus Aenigmarchaeota archaeon]|nr:proteasome assembly chaperone family protein [Candidatus Aenigmarchaeota archaeon]